MKELFNVMVKTSLEDYFVEKIIPESLKYELRDSKKIDVRLCGNWFVTSFNNLYYF